MEIAAGGNVVQAQGAPPRIGLAPSLKGIWRFVGSKVMVAGRHVAFGTSSKGPRSGTGFGICEIVRRPYSPKLEPTVIPSLPQTGRSRMVGWS